MEKFFIVVELHGDDVEHGEILNEPWNCHEQFATCDGIVERGFHIKVGMELWSILEFVSFYIKISEVSFKLTAFLILNCF